MAYLSKLIICFGVFTKIKKGLVLAFGAYFLHGFFIQMVHF